MTEPGTVPVAPRAFLSRHAPFDTFSAQALDRVENFLEMRFAARGETIFARENPPIDALWIVRKGRVRLERDGEVLEVVEPGECFGFPSLIANRSPGCRPMPMNAPRGAATWSRRDP